MNILLSFAQFEREVIGERIRDKFAASRRKGMWMGGNVPFGYRVENRKLLIQEDEAAIVRSIFERFLLIGSATILARTLNAEGLRRKNGKAFDKGLLYKLLPNRVYIGDAVHKGASFPGEHQAIIGRELWDKVRSIVAESPSKRAGQTRRQTPALLKGLIFAPSGYAMTPVHTRKKGKLYRYYVTTSVQKLGPETCPVRRVPAGEIEAAVIDQLRALLRTPEMIVKTWMATRKDDSDITETEVREALVQLDPLWDELFPAEQARIVQLLVERVDAAGSTLRRTLGCLLAAELGIELRRVGSTGRYTFTDPGECVLDSWLDRHAFVARAEIERPWGLEKQLISSDLRLPFNVDGNTRVELTSVISAARSEARKRADALPILLDSGGSRKGRATALIHIEGQRDQFK
ncbi:hypothetical protein BQ8482_280015 [Mesorhizobium delmotii]|uniref:Recombinase family protein n=1 Tax=Mesorhizobium delmotii TaxID=1631247 RepID=A0A2P9AMB7_9HYPH|nr:hypothetical protein BQ8482_280015 [Mesorhizobium delmotii]